MSYHRPHLNRDERARLVALVDAQAPLLLGPAPRDRRLYPWSARAIVSEPDRLCDRGLARFVGEKFVEWPGAENGDNSGASMVRMYEATPKGCAVVARWRAEGRLS